jgi:hypothetical protein
MKRITSKGLRDLFFLAVGSAILFHEFWQRPDPSPLGVFVALFLFGLIPAFRADEGTSAGPLALLVQALAGRGGPETKGPAEDPAARAAREDEVAREAARVVLADRVAREAQRVTDERKRSPRRSDGPESE